MKEEVENQIIKAEEGPKRADRKPETLQTGKCSACGAGIHFFRSENWVCCLNCGIWTRKPVNGEARTI